MATEEGIGPPVPRRPTVILPAKRNAGAVDEVAPAPPARPAPARPAPARPAPVRSAPVAPRPAPPSSQADGLAAQDAPALPPRPEHKKGSSRPPLQDAVPAIPNKQAGTKRARPVITVVDARPMNEVGFRGISPVPSSSVASEPQQINTKQPESAKEAEAPEKPVSTNQAQPTAPPRAARTSAGSTFKAVPDDNTSNVSTITNQSKSQSDQNAASGVVMRQSTRGRPPPPRPVSVPVRPSAPRPVATIKPAEAASKQEESTCLIDFSPDKETPPQEITDNKQPVPTESRRPPLARPRPVSRPQSLQFGATSSVTESPSDGSSGYGSQLPTSESQSSLAATSDDTSKSPDKKPSPPTPRKPLGVQVLPVMGAGGIGSFSVGKLKPVAGEQKEVEGESGDNSAPIPSPRSNRKALAPSPQPRKRNSALVTKVEPNGEARSEPKSVNEPMSPVQSTAQQKGVMVLPSVTASVVSPKAPSPKPRASHALTTSTAESEEADHGTGPSTKAHQPPTSPKPEKQPPSSSSPETSPPSIKPKPATKPKPGVRPKPVVTPKPKGPKPAEKPKPKDKAENQLYPDLPHAPGGKMYPNLANVALSTSNDSFYDDKPMDDSFYSSPKGKEVMEPGLKAIARNQNIEAEGESSKNKPVHPENEVVEPNRPQRPTIIRSKKPANVDPEISTESLGQTEAGIETKEDAKVLEAPVKMRKPTIIRPSKRSAQRSEEAEAGREKVNTENIGSKLEEEKQSDRTQKERPPVSPKPFKTDDRKTLTESEMAGISPTHSPEPPVSPGTQVSDRQSTPVSPSPIEKVKQTVPPPRPKPVSPRAVLRQGDESGNQRLSRDGDSDRSSQRKSNLSHTDSVSSVEEVENVVNEMHLRRVSGASSPSMALENERRHHNSSGSSSSDRCMSPDKGSAHGEGTEGVRETKGRHSKLWVPPGAVRVMGLPPLPGSGTSPTSSTSSDKAPPPLPQSGPVAASMPDLREDATASMAAVQVLPREPRAGGRRAHSPPPPTSGRLTHDTRPKSVSMMALHKPSTESDASRKAQAPQGTNSPPGTIVEEELPNTSTGAAPAVTVPQAGTDSEGHQTETSQGRKPRRPPPARPAAPSPKDQPGNTTGVSEEGNLKSEPHPRSPPPARPTAPVPRTNKNDIRQDTGEEQLQQGAGHPGEKPARKVLPQRAAPPVPRAAARSAGCEQRGRGKGPPPKLPVRPGLGHPLYHYTVKGPHGIALFDYNASDSEELSFKAGDVIELEEQLSDGWMIGRTINKKGMFPVNFVDVVEAPPLSKTKKRQPSISSTEDDVRGSGPRCIARFDYEGEDEEDLSFVPGDIISLLEHIGDEWLRGRLNGKEGMFPLAFVEIVEDLPLSAPGAPESASSNTVTATYDFQGEAGELSFQKGDKVEVLSKVNADWLFGKAADGSTGTFPAGFVDRMPMALPLLETLPADNNEHDCPSPETEEPHCIAQYDFDGDDEDLSFKKDDKITLIGQLGSDWLRGKLGDKEGTFPRSYVTIIKDLEDITPCFNEGSSEQKPVAPQGHEIFQRAKTGRAIALYDFEGEEDEDLSLKVGDDLVLIEKMSDGWYLGSNGEKQGMFPAGYAKIIEEPE